MLKWAAAQKQNIANNISDMAADADAPCRPEPAATYHLVGNNEHHINMYVSVSVHRLAIWGQSPYPTPRKRHASIIFLKFAKRQGGGAPETNVANKSTCRWDNNGEDTKAVLARSITPCSNALMDQRKRLTKMSAIVGS